VANHETGPAHNVLNVTVLANGRILLDGREVSLDELEDALQAAKIDGATVQYDREDPASEAPPEAAAVMKIITDNRLRIVFSPQSGQSAKVLEFPGMEQFFAKVRRQAGSNRGVLLVRPDQKRLILPAPAEGSINAKLIEGVNAVISSDEPRNIAAIAPEGTLTGDPRRLPFLGLLIGLAYMGRAVWLFEALPVFMPAGCEDADVLVVDSDAIAALPNDWVEDAGAVMRNANILVYDRSRRKIGAMRTAGEVPGRIEFLRT
jgi:hypothetical protein